MNAVKRLLSYCVVCVCVCANAEGGDDHKLFMTDGRLFSRLLGQARYRESPVRP